MTDNLPQRDERGYWLKGQSGNPAGKPARIHEIEKLAREYSVAALNRIVALLDSKDDRVALAAANSLLDRGFGKAPIAVHSENVKWDMSALHSLYLQALQLQPGDEAKTIEAEPAKMRIIEGMAVPVPVPDTASAEPLLAEQASEGKW